MSSMKLYKNDRPKLGLVEIINNLSSEHIDTQKDVSEITSAFEGVNMEVAKPHLDLNESAMKQTLDDILDPDRDLKAYNIFTLVMICHGKMGDVHCSADEKICSSVAEIVKKIDAIDDMKGYPKIVILECCRGEGENTPLKKTTSNPVNQHNGFLIPMKADILVVFATVSEFVSFTDRDGSPFLQILARKIRELATTDHLEQILTKVKFELSQKEIEYQLRRLVQMAQTSSTLRGEVFLKLDEEAPQIIEIPSVKEEQATNLNHSDALQNNTINEQEEAKNLTRLTSAPFETAAKASVERESETYNMNHHRRGKAVIFNHENFDARLGLRKRNGTNADLNSLSSTLTSFGFEVVVHNDLSYKHIVQVIEETSSEDHSDADCVMVVLLTHGEQSIVFAHDIPYKLNSIWEPFTSDRCPTLAGKPKIFLIQACQGDKLDSGTVLKKSPKGVASETMSYTIPTNADFIFAYATMPGYYSWRNSLAGSWFIQSFCRVMDTYGATDDLLYNLTRVARRVAIDYQSNTPGSSDMHGKKQIPCIMSMLTRSVVFIQKK